MRWTKHVTWVGIGWSVATAFAGCGDEDAGGGSSGGTGGSTADGSGVGGAAGSTGGASGAAGRVDGAAGSSGEAGAGPDGSVDAGPACRPREELAPPVPRDVDVAAACMPVEGCGGPLTGTSWEVEAVCVPRDRLLGNVRAVCSAATFGATFDARPRGTATFDAARAEIDLGAEVSFSVDFPNACHGCRCGDLETSLLAAGVTGASCNPQCLGGTCFCTFTRTVSLGASDAYTTDSDSLDLASGETLPYCVSGDTLEVEGPGGTVYTLRPPEHFRTPEICDGRDNDGNGSVDDDLAECPTCSTAGVCGEGVVAECRGTSGWSCTYSSPAWERDETLCDAVDNDCDGEVNEGLGCVEICDGVDNDGNGTVDDTTVGAPACSTAGVCAAGHAASCDGASGWSCSAVSSRFEAAESACDGADNDCNGLVDERCCAAGSGRMYYSIIDAARTGAFVVRANLDGSGATNLVTLPLATLLDVSVDPQGGKLYWANITDGSIQRSNLDGSGVETALIAPSQPRLTLDLAGRTLFWKGPMGITRTRLDDLSSHEVVLTGASPLSMAADPQRGWLYLGEGQAVLRANFDGSGVLRLEGLSTIGQVIEGIAVDPVGSQVYWTATGGLYRASLDLTNPEKILDASYPHHVHVLPVARRLYWSDTPNDDLYFMDIGASSPQTIALDVATVRFGQVVDCP